MCSFRIPLQKKPPMTQAKHEEMKRMLDASLGLLDPKYREPLVLYYFEDLDLKSISQVLHIPVSTIATRIKKGKLMLGKIVKP